MIKRWQTNLTSKIRAKFVKRFKHLYMNNARNTLRILIQALIMHLYSYYNTNVHVIKLNWKFYTCTQFRRRSCWTEDASCYEYISKYGLFDRWGWWWNSSTDGYDLFCCKISDRFSTFWKMKWINVYQVSRFKPSACVTFTDITTNIHTIV